MSQKGVGFVNENQKNDDGYIDFVEVRKRIEGVGDPFVRSCLSAIYLACARVSEIVSIPMSYDEKHKKSNTYGLKVADVSVIQFPNNGVSEPVLVMGVKTAKRKGMLRRVAIPIKHDPLAKHVILHKKVLASKSKYPFMYPITRNALWRVVNRELEVFKGLKYKIFPYIREDLHISEHTRLANLHFLRHARANELLYHYNLDVMEIASIGGWKLSTMQNIAPNILTPVMERYVYVNYQKYLPKLFIPAPS